MASMNDFPARGKVSAVKDGGIVFLPADSNYELHLDVPGGYRGPVGQSVEGFIRVQARKVWTVPSGGNFIVPIFGPPRIVQGRVRHIEPGQLVVHATVPFIFTLPQNESALDLPEGPIGLNIMVNVTVLPGASFEWLG